MTQHHTAVSLWAAQTSSRLRICTFFHNILVHCLPSHHSLSFCPDLGASLWPCIAIVCCFQMRSKIWQSELRSNCTHRSGRSGNKKSRCNMSFGLQSIFHSLEIRPQMKIIVATMYCSSCKWAHLKVPKGERKVVRQARKKQKQGRDCRVGKKSLPFSVIGLMPFDQELGKPFRK